MRRFAKRKFGVGVVCVIISFVLLAYNVFAWSLVSVSNESTITVGVVKSGLAAADIRNSNWNPTPLTPSIIWSPNWTPYPSTELFRISGDLENTVLNPNQAARNRYISKEIYELGVFSGLTSDFQRNQGLNGQYDLVFARVVLQNWSNTPVYCRVKLEAPGSDFNAAYAVALKPILPEEPIVDPLNPTTNANSSPLDAPNVLQYVSSIGDGNGWFYYDKPLLPHNDKTSDHDEYSLWIAAFIYDGGSGPGDIHIGLPAVEFIQANGGAVFYQDGWKDDVATESPGDPNKIQLLSASGDHLIKSNFPNWDEGGEPR